MKQTTAFLILLIVPFISRAQAQLFSQIGTTDVWKTSTTSGTVRIGINTVTPQSLLDISTNSSSVVPALSVYHNSDPNLGIKLMTGVGDGATFTSWNGGFGSWNGIGFYSTLDGVTRGVFNARTGDFSLKGSINSNGSGIFNGNLQLGTDGVISTIFGPTSSGAIQIKSNVAQGGAANRYLRLGWRDNNGVFLPALSVNDDLNIGIGTVLSNNPNGYKLAVKGKIGAQEVQVENTSTTWADYVFEPTYKLMDLSDVAVYVKENKHLPEIPSADDVKMNGHKLGEMDVLLLKKVEELTLYVIELKKENEALKKDMQSQQEEINALKK